MTEATSRGLTVVKRGRAWYVKHTASRLPVAAHVDLRLRRQAAAFMNEMYATGIDFTEARPKINRRAERVVSAWTKRVRDCCDPRTGEHYNPYTYRKEDGRCV